MPRWSAQQTFASLSVPQYRMLWLGGSFAYLAFGMAQTVRAVVAEASTEVIGMERSLPASASNLVDPSNETLKTRPNPATTA